MYIYNDNNNDDLRWKFEKIFSGFLLSFLATGDKSVSSWHFPETNLNSRFLLWQIQQKDRLFYKNGNLFTPLKTV